MRILFDQGVHEMRNLGNLSMLQIATERIERLWPDANLEVLSIAPRLTKIYFPTLYPVSPDGSYNWPKKQTGHSAALQLLPRPMLLSLFELRERLWYRRSALKSGHVRARHPSELLEAAEHFDSETACTVNQTVESETGDAYRALLQGVDLFIAAGGQYMADVVKMEGIRVLDRLEAAVQLGIPTAMVGQGMGPIDDPELHSRASTVLPLVDLIFIREDLEVPKLLNSFAVDPDGVILTGDDGIELAFQQRTLDLGDNIGIGLRVAYYSEVSEKDIESLGQVIQQATAKYKTSLIGVPISQTADEGDERFIQQLGAGANNIWRSNWRFKTPSDVIKKAGRCRLVITGAFHSAVFALAQGIPAVCLARSDHYKIKFLGLANQFNVGCAVVLLSEEQWQEKLATEIDNAWHTAEEIRPQLLKAAAHQNEMGNAAYQRLYDLVESRGLQKEVNAERLEL